MQRAHYSTAIFLASMPFVFLNFALPVYGDDLGLTPMMIGGTYAVFTLTMLILRPLIGLALDLYGRRWFFISAFLFYTLAMLAFAQLAGTSGLYLGRLLQGVGAALMWVSVRTIVADVEVASGYAEGMGRLITQSVRGSMVGATIGFTLLGFLPMTVAWVWAFTGYAALALAAFVWSCVVITETRPAETQSTASISVWARPRLRRILWMVLMAGFASALVEPIYLLFLKQKFSLDAMLLGLLFLPAGIVFAFVPRYAGAWADLHGRGRVIAMGMVLAALVTMALPFWPMVWPIALCYIFFSVGWAMANPAIDALIAEEAGAHERGRLLGHKEMAQGVGLALGPMVGTTLYQHVAAEVPFVLNGLLLLFTAFLVSRWFGGSGDKTVSGEKGIHPG